jgi:hypothetical protein
LFIEHKRGFKMKNKIDRRSFVKFATGSLLAIPVLANINLASANDPDRLSEEDAMAKALGYKENTTEVDASSHPNHKDVQNCLGCVLYQGSDPEWGGCGAFPGKKVAGQGWCVAYAPKPA